MSDDARHQLVEAARLDERAGRILGDLPDEGAEQLLDAWRAAVRRQDAEVDAAIEGSLSLLPRLVRRRVMKILTRGRR